MRDGHDFRVELHPIAQGCGQPRAQPIVAAVDPIQLHPGFVVRRKLIDERKERQVLGICEKEPPEAGGDCPQIGVGFDLVQPAGYRSPAKVSRDRGVPTLFCQTVDANQTREGLRKPVPPARRLRSDDAHPTGCFSSDVAKPTAQNGNELETKLLGQLPDFALAFVDEIAAGFGMLAARRRDRAQSSTRPPTRLRASTTVTSAPFSIRSRAAASPASPAPATSTRTPPSAPVVTLVPPGSLSP